MNAPGRYQTATLLLVLLATILLTACAGDALPTMVATVEPPPAPVLPAEPTAIPPPPPAIITLPAPASGSAPGGAVITLPSGDSSSQVVIQTGAPGTAIPAEVQQLLDDLASGAILLNSSPAGQDGEPVNYAYRDINRDGTRDLVIIVVAEPAAQSPPAAEEPAAEPVQAIGINLDALVASINANPDAPLVRSAFVYTVSQEELERLDDQ